MRGVEKSLESQARKPYLQPFFHSREINKGGFSLKG